MLKRIYRFEIDREIVRNNQSAVYEARDVMDNSPVLLCEWAPDSGYSDADADRFSQAIPSLSGVEPFSSDSHFYIAASTREALEAAIQTLQAQQLFIDFWPRPAAPPPPQPAPPPPQPAPPPPPSTPRPAPPPPPTTASNSSRLVLAVSAVGLALLAIPAYVWYKHDQDARIRTLIENAREDATREQAARDAAARQAAERAAAERRAAERLAADRQRNEEALKSLDVSQKTEPLLRPVEPLPRPVEPLPRPLEKDLTPSRIIAQPLPPPALKVAAVCIQNPTGTVVRYQLSWSGKKETRTLKSGENQTYETPAGGDFRIDFDNNFAPGYTGASIPLPANDAQSPAKCEVSRQYYFTIQGQQLGLLPRTWTPGFIHPFAANVVQSDKSGNWLPVSGYRWYNPDDSRDLSVVPKDVGFIGIAVTKDAASAYCKIQSLRPNGPAARANLTAGMLIRRINGALASGWSAAQCQEAIRGPLNTRVTLEVFDGGRNAVYTVNIVRQ